MFSITVKTIEPLNRTDNIIVSRNIRLDESTPLSQLKVKIEGMLHRPIKFTDEISLKFEYIA